MDVFDRLGTVQFDPISVAGRNHDLVLHARVAGYDPAWCDELYERREIFEAYNKGLSFDRVEEFPWFRAGLSKGASQILDDNPRVAERVLERVRAEGPLSSLDFETERGATTDWFGAPTNTVRAVLEALTITGVLGLARRDGNRRHYDPVERLLPAEILARDVPLREKLRHKLLSRYRAHGLLGAGGGYDIFSGLGPAKASEKYPGRNALREELVERGEILPVDVEGVRGKRFVVADEVELLEAPPEPPPSVALLPPFDALVWDRALLGSLFGFEYVWELGLVRAADPVRRPVGRPDRAADRARRIPRARSRRLVGKTASRRGAPRDSWRRCTTRSARTWASRARTASAGRLTSAPRSDSSPARRSRTWACRSGWCSRRTTTSCAKACGVCSSPSRSCRSSPCATISTRCSRPSPANAPTWSSPTSACRPATSTRASAPLSSCE
jgi:uncharacterized protein